MQKEKPNYFAIIPARVRYDTFLKPSEKLLYAEITSLATKDGYCWATNSYFAELYNVSKFTVSRWVSHLESRGFIKTSVVRDGNNQVTERKIFLNYIPIDRNSNTPIDENNTYPIDEKSKENNTSINNTSINNIYSQVDSINTEKNNNLELAKEIIDYLNLKANKKFKPTTPKTKQLINTRVKEGFTKGDFIKVIDTKCKSWLGTEWERYLRPETLFGTKFESYLNEEVKDGYSIKSDTRKDDKQAKKWDIDGLIFTGE